LTSMTRHREGWSKDGDAANFDKDSFVDLIDDIKAFIIERIKSINVRSGNRLKDDISDVEDEMNAFFDFWQELATKSLESNVPLYFGHRYMVQPPMSSERRLLRQYNSPGQDIAFETLTSMRNVDTQVKGKIVIWEG